jgi:hypothetical protein
MKAMCSNEASAWVDVLRRSCGGHGYLLSSNLPKIFATVTASCTYEGENTVLWLQVARFANTPGSSLFFQVFSIVRDSIRLLLIFHESDRW